MLGLILVSGLGVLSLLFAMLVLACFLLRKTHRRGQDGSQECDGKFRGISSRASFKAAIHRSLANQTHNTAAIVYTVDEYQDPFSYLTCPTCSLIAEGSSMAYHDDSCPQCGEDTSHLTDTSINRYV